uniref:SH3 domain-containing protein n=1 Tax=Heterorhabditis bacteriophora TaxID=37862 RepID=A0A1I7W8W0_HETBA
MGAAEATKLDDQFNDMEKNIDTTFELISALVAGTNEYLQPNPGIVNVNNGEAYIRNIVYHLSNLKFMCAILIYDHSLNLIVLDDELIQAEEKLEESKRLAEMAMFNVLSNDVEQISQLRALVDAQLDFHRQTAQVLENLQAQLQSRVKEASCKPRPEHHPLPVLSSRTPRSRYLNFKEGNIIELISQVDENWYEGRLNGKSGLFPVTYVQVLVPLSNLHYVFFRHIFIFVKNNECIYILDQVLRLLENIMAGGMHFLIGISTDDFVILASDKASFAYGAILADNNNDKEYRLGTKLTMMCIGEEGDVAQFGDWTKRNIRLYAIRNGYELSPRSSHHWIRRSIAEALRTQDHYAVDILLGGFDDIEGKAFLGSVDYLGNGLGGQVMNYLLLDNPIYYKPYLFRGFCGRFCYAILDREYKKSMSLEEGLGMVHKCILEAKKRFVANIPGYKVVVIDKNGYRQLDDINL